MKYLIALNHFPKFGPVRLKKLSKYFQSYEQAFNADLIELQKAGLEENLASEFISKRKEINIDKILDNLNQENIKTISLSEESYPKLLKEIYNPPPLLYYKGNLDKVNEYAIAIVGSRNFSTYGQQTTIKFSQELTKLGFIIVSGLALGIDAIAHDVCLENHGTTIAVLGSGIDKTSISPSSNRFLAEKIINNNGLIISEFPPKTPPLKFNFPQRNRIISGLSLGVLVIEANEKSGTLITAELALEQNRDVFAVPGSIFSPSSIGTNKLIKQGAKLCISSNDILEALDMQNVIQHVEAREIIGETEEEKIILKNLKTEPIHIDELCRVCQMSSSTIGGILIIMEMKGMVKNLGNMMYVQAV